MNGPYPIKCARAFAHGRVAGTARHDQDVCCGDVVKTGIGVKRQVPGVISDRTFGFATKTISLSGIWFLIVDCWSPTDSDFA